MKKLLLLLYVSIATTAFAQNKINFEQGNFDFLKDQAEVNVQLIFDNSTYQERNFTEAQYLENRKADITAKKTKLFGRTGFINGGSLKSLNIWTIFSKELMENQKK